MSETLQDFIERHLRTAPPLTDGQRAQIRRLINGPTLPQDKPKAGRPDGR